MATYPAFLVPVVAAVAVKHLLPLHAAHLCSVYGRFTTPTGAPVRNLVVSFSSTFQLPIVARAGQAGIPAEAQTDVHGELEVQLVRGSVLDISIYGTGYHRRVTVPDRAEQDLFYLLSDGQDVFSQQIADVLVAPRRSL